MSAEHYYIDLQRRAVDAPVPTRHSDQPAMKIGLFAHHFPHKKPQDFLARPVFEGYQVEAIPAADPVELNVPHSAIKSEVARGR